MLPRVILHNAVSLDGRTDWFGADIGLYYELSSRWGEDATLAGCDTMLAAELLAVAIDEQTPKDELPDHSAQASRPILVVVDSRGRLRNWVYWRQQPHWRDCVAFVSNVTPRGYLNYLRDQQVEYVLAGDDRVDLRMGLEELNAKYGVKTVRVDSGGTLNGALLRAGLVDEVSVLIHPSLVGGLSPTSLYRAPDLQDSDQVMPLRLTRLEKLRGDVIWLTYEVTR